MAILYACCRCRFFLYAVVASIFFLIIDLRSERKSANAAVILSARPCLVSSIISSIVSTITFVVESHFGLLLVFLLLLVLLDVDSFFFSVVGVGFVGVGGVGGVAAAAATNAEQRVTRRFIILFIVVFLVFIDIGIADDIIILVERPSMGSSWWRFHHGW